MNIANIFGVKQSYLLLNMRQTFILFIICAFTSVSSFGNGGYKIDISIENYDQDTLVAGYYFGKQTLVLDTLLKSETGDFLLQDTATLDPGVYLLLLKPDNEFVQFLVDEAEQEFSISFDATDLTNVTVNGSAENDLFNIYMGFLRGKRALREPLVAERDAEGMTDIDKEPILKKIEILDADVKAEQDRIVDGYPESITTLLIKANRPLETPNFEGTEDEIHQKKYAYYRAHYFDNIEMDNPKSIRTPFFNDRIDYFLKKLTYQVPDSLVKSVDYILNEIQPAEKTYQYYLSQFINDFANSKIVGQDAVYVHIAENYYGAGKAPWVDEESQKKIVSDALKLKPILIGKTAPEFTAYNADGDEVALSSIDADFRVLFFWKPDCGHCTKAIPVVKEFYDAYKDKGVTIITVCTKLGKDYNKCWEGIDERKDMMSEFINLGDQYQRSKVLKKYNATQTPRFFVLDKEDTIVMKGIGANQLGAVMDEMLQRAAKK